MNKEIIPVFFAIDNGYAPLLAVAVESLLENANKDYFYKIYVIHEDLTNENKEKLESLKNNNSEIIFEEMNRNLKSITNKEGHKLRADYFTLTIFFRLFIPDMFKEYDKAIYIDSDVVVPGDISKLYNIDLEDNLIGGCVDLSIKGIEEIKYNFKNAVGVDPSRYINSGVLLLNMKKLREKKLSEKFLYLLDKYNFNTIAPDQDYLNALCKDKIKYLDKSWNAMPAKGQKLLENPNLIHYNLFAKPWHYKDVGYKEYFWDYAKKTPYYNKLLDILENYTDKEKEEDNKSLKNLLKLSIEYSNEDITFKKVFESGKESRL